MPPVPSRRSSMSRHGSASAPEKGELLPPVVTAAEPRTTSRLTWRRLLFTVLASLALLWQATTLLTSTYEQARSHGDGPINVILMISDGYGPASHTLARYFHQAALRDANSTSSDEPLNFPSDQYLVGSHRSRSSSSLITDSAAGATAFSCGIKTYNGAIGVDSKGKPCRTIFEAAKEQDYLTGVVVTSRLTDATPACFYAHASSRALESTIAAQMLEAPHKGAERTIDLAIGGGGCYFLPKSDPGSCRTDDRDLLTEATDAGWDVRIGETISGGSSIRTEAKGAHGERLVTFKQDKVNSTSANSTHAAYDNEPHLPYLSVLTSFNTPYVVDLPADQEGKDSFPTLSELTEQALSVLTRQTGSAKTSKHKKHPRKRQGFMLMIEGSQIDLCQHQNDPGCMVREAVAFQSALGKVIKHVDALNKRGERTIVIATSDHETGGLDLGRQLGPDYPEYVYYPERLLAVRGSAQTLSRRLLDFAHDNADGGPDPIKEYVITHILGPNGGLGFGSKQSGGQIVDEEVERVLACLPENARALDGATPPIDSGDHCRQAIADVLSRRARLGWSTQGHTAVDINVYAHGYGAEKLRGNMENTHIGTFIADLLGLKLGALAA